MTDDLNAEWQATFESLDRHTADMERRIADGEVTDPAVIAMVRRTRAAIQDFHAAEADAFPLTTNRTVEAKRMA